MRILFVLFMMLAILASVASLIPYQKHDTQHAEAMAENWMTYRNAVVRYAENHPGTLPASIPQASLPLPPGYTALAAWQNQTSGRTLYIYGAAGMDSQAVIMDAQGVSDAATGYANAGQWYSPEYGNLGVAAPTYVTNGDLLSMVTVQ